MKDIFWNALDFNAIGDKYKDRLELDIDKVAISKENAVLWVSVRLNFVVPCASECRIKGAIKEKLPALNGVIINYVYSNVVTDTADTVRLAIPHAIAAVSGNYAVATRTIRPDEYEFDGKKLTLSAVGATAVEELNKSAAKEISTYFDKNFGIKTDVAFVNSTGEYKRAQAALEENDAALIAEQEKLIREAEARASEKPKKAAPQSDANGRNQWYGRNDEGGFRGYRRRDTYKPVDGDIIMGSHIDGEVTPLSQITPEKGVVIAEGTVFKKDVRTIKNDRRLAMLVFTDKTTSMCIKSFVSPEKWNDIDKYINEGTYIRVRGEAQFDTFENMTVIMAHDIELKKAEKRKDNAPRKRVELHLHTKMSKMDGVAETKDIVNTLGSWGFPAMAVTDHGVVQSFPDASHAAGKFPDMKIIYGMEGYVFDDADCIMPDGSIDYKSRHTNHIILLAQNRTGLLNLYKLVSFSHINYFYKVPRIPWSVLETYREGIIVGSACEAGEVYRSVRVGLPEAEQERIASRYDYLEVQPLTNDQFMIDEGIVNSRDDLIAINKRIIELGERLGKPVCATTDAHYIDPDDALYRQILMAGQGYGDEGGQGLYLKTTEEMLGEFSYLTPEKAEEIVIDNPNAIADMIEQIEPVPKGKFPPNIENAAEMLRERCMKKAHETYGDPLPDVIAERLDAELTPLIREGYAVMYMAAVMLVQKSLSDGYLVGSRGSVGSSFAATMAGITEVNPLPPHYICPNCKHLEWGDENEYDCGVDMPEKNCPVCGTKYKQDGFSIPFQTFLGFEGDKEPDIDLNFAGEYQPVAHRYVDEIFGAKNVFKAGTIGTVKDATAYGFVMKYFEEKGITPNKYEADRLSLMVTGVKRTTSQHPGGIIIVPDDHEIYEFCPIQYPANDASSGFITTHFDYHSIDQNLLKLDILGHDVPSMIRHLQDMTGLDPLKDVPLKDEKVNSIFVNADALDIKDPEYRFVHGSFGIPEFGTRFTRQMLDDTHPTRFGDLVRISGFSHGTDVWVGNAQKFIKNGDTTIKDAISTRDDIMNYLILKGLPKKTAFSIMENVRKGNVAKGKCNSWREWSELMRSYDVPEWYIESCEMIKYMFPRAHAVAYVMMSYRIAYFKVYYPVEFYAAYFTSKVSEFDANTILAGKAAVLAKMDALASKSGKLTKKEEDEIIVLEVAYEMYARGYEFKDIELGKSQAVRFMADEGKVLLPYVAIQGMGEKAAKQFYEENEAKPFETVEEAQERSGVTKATIEALKAHGVFKGIPETDQLSLF